MGGRYHLRDTRQGMGQGILRGARMRGPLWYLRFCRYEVDGLRRMGWAELEKRHGPGEDRRGQGRAGQDMMAWRVMSCNTQTTQHKTLQCAPMYEIASSSCEATEMIMSDAQQGNRLNEERQDLARSLIVIVCLCDEELNIYVLHAVARSCSRSFHHLAAVREQSRGGCVMHMCDRDSI